MGRIPFYERQQLASSRVGTPGIDRTGAILADVGESIGQMTQKYVDAENAKIEVADNIEAEKHRIELENQYNKQIEEAKQKNIDNPYGVSDGAMGMGNSLASEMASNITNPRVRAKFMAKAQHSIVSEQDKIRTWASTQTSTNAFINYNVASEGLATQGAAVKSPAELQSLLNSAEKLAINAAPVVGAERAHKVYEVTRKEMYKNYAYANIDKSPETVKSYVDQGIFDGVLDEKEQLSLKSSADSLIRKRQVAAERQNREYHVDTISSLYAKNLDGDLTLKEINGAISQFRASGATKSDLASLVSIRKSLLGEGGGSGGGGGGGKGKPGKVTYQEQANTLVAITDSYLNIFTKTGAEGKLKSRDTAFSDLQALQNNIIKAVSEKKLDKQTGNSMLKNVVRGKQALSNTKKEVVTNDGFMGLGKRTKEIPLGTYNEGLKTVNAWANKNISNPKLRAQFQHDVITEYVSSYDSVKGKKGFSVNKYTNQIIGHYATKYGKTAQVKKVK